MKKKFDVSILNDKKTLKNRINIVLTREPFKYKEIVEKFKNIFFNSNENIHDNILLFPYKYNDMNFVLDKFFKIFIIRKNEICKTIAPTCKILWVTKNKQDCGCDLFFDYNLENNFHEEKVFETKKCSIYKYTKL
jgi:dihydrofolate reductase